MQSQGTQHGHLYLQAELRLPCPPLGMTHQNFPSFIDATLAQTLPVPPLLYFLYFMSLLFLG